MTEAVTRTATQDGTAKNQAGLLWAMKKSEPSNPSLFASHIGQHNPVTLRPRRQNADTSATAKTTVYFSVDRRPPPTAPPSLAVDTWGSQGRPWSVKGSLPLIPCLYCNVPSSGFKDKSLEQELR